MGAVALNLPLGVWRPIPRIQAGKTSPFGELVKRRGPENLRSPVPRVTQPCGLGPHWRARAGRSRVGADGPRAPPCSLLLAAARGLRLDDGRAQEPSLTVTRRRARETPAAGARRPARTRPRIAVVTHGQASSPFWAIVRTGVDAAERQMDVQVDYEAPDVYSARAHDRADRRRRRDRSPTGSSSRSPSPASRPRSGAPSRPASRSITINSGSDALRALGVLAHVGQPEGRAGLAAGRRLARAGVRRALCVNQQVGNSGPRRPLRRPRARDARAPAATLAGARHRRPEHGDARGRIARGRRPAAIDGILATNATSGLQSVDGGRERATAPARVKIGAFDLGARDVLEAVRAGKLLFAVDQQPYLPGLPARS